MTKTDIILPTLGEGVIEAVITKIPVKQGDLVSEDDILVEIATDKVDSEITAPTDGKIGEILFKENDIVKVGETILYLIDEKENTYKNTLEKPEPKKEDIIEQKTEKEEVKININSIKETKNTLIPENEKLEKFISPLVKSIAKKEGINISKLNKIQGTGEHGRLTKRDVVKYLAEKETTDNRITKKENKPENIKTESKHEIVEMDRVRKLIADHMLNSIKTSVHVTSFVEVDMTDIVEWRNNTKDEFLKKEGEKLTFTPIFIDAVVKAIKEFPMINVSVEGDNIIKKRNINIGMATALPDGNLIVPVIKNADKMNLAGLARSVNDLAQRARKNNLLPEEIQDGTFTITNFGTFNNIAGTPIINQPQVAIIGIGTIKKQVSVIETNKGDTIGIRHKMILSLSYDHRVVDGALGGMFLAKIGEYLEKYV